MIEPFDISELPERITQYRNQVLSEALTRNAPYIRQMTEGKSDRQAASMWQSVAQHAVNALGNYMEPRVDTLMDGDDPRIVFYEHDWSEPILSYVHAWIEGYATRALGGRCSEGEVRPAVEQAGISLYPIDNRIAYAETILPQRGYSRECVSVAIGHAILSYAISLSDELSQEDRIRFNWMGDIDGFADGWRYAQRHDLGYDEEYVPYSDEDQIGDFMRSLSEPSQEESPGEDGTEDAFAQDDDGYDDFVGVEEDGSQEPEHKVVTPASTSVIEVSLPDRYASVFEQADSPSQETVQTTGIYVEVDEGQVLTENPDGSTGIIMTDDSEVFTTDEIPDATGDETDNDLLHIKTTVDETSNSLTGSLVAVVPLSTKSDDITTVTERAVKRLPPVFEKYLILSVSSAFRGNANRLADLTEAGMTFEQSEHLKRKVLAATAKYGLRELSLMRRADGVPAALDGTEPVRTYANSWIQGYISVITDGDYSQDAIIKSALMSVVTGADIADDVRHVVERQEWEGYDDECSMVTVAHLKVSLSMHGKGHPMAHAMEGTGRFNRRGATDGFSDGWWKAMEILRRVSETPDLIPGPLQVRQDEPKDPSSSEDITKAKEEAKMLLAGLFNEEDILPEESVNELIGPPMPIVAPKPQERRSHEDRRHRREQELPAMDSLERTTDGNDQLGQDDSDAMSQAEDVQSQEQLQVESKMQSTQDRIRKHADTCAMQAIKQNANAVKDMWGRNDTNKDMARAWTNAVMQAAASYGWHVVTDLKANPAKSKDGTRPMLTYASGWVMGYVVGFGSSEPEERSLEETAQRLGLSFGEIGERTVYAREICSARGYGQDCMTSLMRHVKHMFLTHHPRNPNFAKVPDKKTYNWIADIDGYADGWSIAKRVRMQQGR